ncbi:MAG: restriction endonuclease subunit S [Candidatus Electrothrix sp. Rat3]|nr:restriction endonuclease subunit S [Candidatus Electrothrix rattekaaiensis]
MIIARCFNIGYERGKDEGNIQMRLYPSSLFTHATLKDCGEIVTGSTPSKSNAEFWGGKVPFVTPVQLGFRDPITTANEFVTMDGAERGRMLPKDAVLVCCIGSLGKTGVAGVPLITNQQINAIIFDPNQVEARYGYYAACKLTHLLEHFAPSTTVKIVKKSSFAKMEIPLPSLAEQKRIAKILDAADAMRAKRREALAQLDTFLQSTFLDMFGDPITNPMGWNVTLVEDEVHFLTSGSRGWAKYYADSGDVFIRIQNLKNGKLDLSDIAYVNTPESAEAKRTKVEPGDVLLSITADLGRTAVIPNDIGKAHINQHLAILRFKELNPVFVSYQLASHGGQSQFVRLNREGVKAGLNFNDVRRIQLTKPPLPLQHRFATIVKSVEQQKSRMKTHLAELDTLFEALQQRAFNGDL